MNNYTLSDNSIELMNSENDKLEFFAEGDAYSVVWFTLNKEDVKFLAKEIGITAEDLK